MLLQAGAGAQSFAPRDGFVPDSATAIKIAEEVLVPVYGKEKIEAERPLKATLKDGVWTVDATLHCRDNKGEESQLCSGGAAQIKLSKTDGRILRMIHYK
jgi:NTF2 fold immunity protein